MKVSRDLKVTNVQLENGTTFEVGGNYEDGVIFNIEAGSDFEEEIKDWEFVDWDDNDVSYEDVKLRLDVTDGREGWSVFITGDGVEVIEG